MAKNLVIVESPAKAKTIGKFLGKNYKVEASVGHVRDLPKSKLGVDIEDNFEPQYITIRGKGPVINDIKKAAKKADKIYLATDPDREGEAISWHLSTILKLEEDGAHRIEFNEITKDAIKKAIKTPRQIDKSLVDAQQARRVLDRLVGYSISPLLWRKVRTGLSAGRVQSVATKIICDREKEIKEFDPQEYWTIDLTAENKDKKKIAFKYIGKNNKTVEIKDEKQVNEILKNIDKKNFLIEKIETKERKKSPKKPFTTSSLQQEASNKLRFSTKKTMMVAQQLYEGIDIGKGGSVGLITYIRTDSIRLSDEALNRGKEFIEENLGENYYKAYVVKASKKSKKIQDAHEAIRPSLIDKTPEELEKYLSKDQMKLYKLIWERFISCMMKEAVYENLTITAHSNDEYFRANGSKLKFDGYLKIYSFTKNEDTILPDVSENEMLKVKKIDPKQHFTQPPARYTEASLVKKLEELEIGRPSTYSPTISTIIARDYVKREKSALVPTELGEIINEIMEENFSQFVDVKFTANMEHLLDEVEEGSVQWKNIVAKFYEPLKKDLEIAEEKLEKINIEEETDEICENCGENMVIKYGRYGKFMACKNYPDCKTTKPILNKIGVSCPICEDGDVIARRSKKGRLFYGCSEFPKCKFISWGKPTGEKCPDCSSFLVEKNLKKGNKIVCSNKECKYEREVE
ncbi:MAG: type I DNA topoisomerase [Peptostreptococcaceae bacterium]|jgi:DNA topoisomerase-1|nr:type I DNA topoisomerase [Peptostreptococcaceae bacterium]